MAKDNAQTAALVGQTVGNYEVTSLLGKGGMGEVYRARHPILGREVAVKVLNRAGTEDEALVGRFQQEAMAVSRIDHDAIVEVFDFGTLADGRHYYFMEFFEGNDLREVLESQGPLPFDAAVRIIAPVMEALAAAHRVGIIHRDIKPDNIFLQHGKDGVVRPKILDFGIAKLTDTGDNQQAYVTRTGQLLGTPLYMSPEQAAGDIHQVGPWSDIYSVGVVLYHMVTGRPPFLGRSFGELLVKHMQTPAPSMTTLRADTPPAVDAFAQRCLAKPPGHRFETMQEAIDALMDTTRGVAPALPEQPGMAFQSTALADAPPAAPAAPSMALAATVGQSSISGSTGQQMATQPPLPTSAAAPPRRSGLVFGLGIGIGVLLVAGVVLVSMVMGRKDKPASNRSPANSGQMNVAAATPDAGSAKSAPRPAPKTDPRPIEVAMLHTVTAEAAMPAATRPKKRTAPRSRRRPRATGGSGASRVDGRSANALHDAARKAYQQGGCRKALSLAQRANAKRFSSKTTQLIGYCACSGRRPALARKAYRQLRGRRKVVLAHNCAKYGIRLKPTADPAPPED